VVLLKNLAQTLWLTKSYELMSYLRLMIRCHMNRLSKHPHALSDLFVKERLLPWERAAYSKDRRPYVN